MKSPTFYVDDDRSPVLRGDLEFEYRCTLTKRRGTATVEVRHYACPLCLRAYKERRRRARSTTDVTGEPRLIRAGNIDKHLASHDAQEERKKLTLLYCEAGMSKPLPGQLGFLALGVPDVAPKRRVGRAR
jgi:hypothetical protein